MPKKSVKKNRSHKKLSAIYCTMVDIKKPKITDEVYPIKRLKDFIVPGGYKMIKVKVTEI